MKTYWDIDIDNKIASFKSDEVLYRFKFDVSFDGYLTLSGTEVLENNGKIDFSKMHSYMRYLGDEISFLNFKDKFEFSGETYYDDRKLYKMEDNIYIDDEATLVTIVDGEFVDTTLLTDIDIFSIEDTPIALAKLLIRFPNEEDEYITFAEAKEAIKTDPSILMM